MYNSGKNGTNNSANVPKSPPGGQFLVDIKCAQNGSWQGKVTWVSEKKTVPFRSALELLKLIDSAVEGERPVWPAAADPDKGNGGKEE